MFVINPEAMTNTFAYVENPTIRGYCSLVVKLLSEAYSHTDIYYISSMYRPSGSHDSGRSVDISRVWNFDNTWLYCASTTMTNNKWKGLNSALTKLISDGKLSQWIYPLGIFDIRINPKKLIPWADITEKSFLDLKSTHQDHYHITIKR